MATNDHAPVEIMPCESKTWSVSKLNKKQLAIHIMMSMTFIKFSIYLKIQGGNHFQNISKGLTKIDLTSWNGRKHQWNFSNCVKSIVHSHIFEIIISDILFIIWPLTQRLLKMEEWKRIINNVAWVNFHGLCRLVIIFLSGWELSFVHLDASWYDSITINWEPPTAKSTIKANS